MKMLKVLLVLSIFTPGSVFASGTNVGGGNTGSEYLARWCNAALSTLKAYKKNAIVSLHSYGDYARANQILITGMVKSLERDLDQHIPSLTRKALERGIELSSMLQIGALAQSENQRRSGYEFLMLYYKYLIEEVATKLDIAPYTASVLLPARSCGNCAPDVHTFEKKYVEFALKQLTFLGLGILNPVTEYGIRVYHPSLESVHVLRALELISEYTREDLQQSLWSDFFSCLSYDLDRIGSEVRDYNQGNSALYTDNRMAVHMTADELVTVIHKINNNFSCL